MGGGRVLESWTRGDPNHQIGGWWTWVSKGRNFGGGNCLRGVDWGEQTFNTEKSPLKLSPQNSFDYLHN